MKVAGEWRGWREGKITVFDDSFEHEVEHAAAVGQRVVLLLDVWHPEVTAAEKALLCNLFPA